MNEDRLKKLIRYVSDVSDIADESGEGFNQIRSEIDEVVEEQRAEKYKRVLKEKGLIAPECKSCMNVKMYDKVRDEYYCALCDHE